MVRQLKRPANINGHAAPEPLVIVFVVWPDQTWGALTSPPDHAAWNDIIGARWATTVPVLSKHSCHRAAQAEGMRLAVWHAAEADGEPPNAYACALTGAVVRGPALVFGHRGYSTVSIPDAVAGALNADLGGFAGDQPVEIRERR